MANQWYLKGREKIFAGTVQCGANTLQVVLVDFALYTPDVNAHEFLSSVPAAARVGTPQTLTSKTFTNAVFKAANPTFPAVPAHAPCEALLCFVQGAGDATSPLLFLYDQATSGLPVTPQDNDITIEFSASGIATLNNA